MRRLPLLFPIFLCMVGCGSSIHSAGGTQNLTVTAPLDPSLKYFRAYGDSITFGFNLPDRTLAFPTLVANYNKLTGDYRDYSNPGDQACDIPTHQIFQRFENPYTILKGLYSIMIGTNDADVKLTGPYEVTYNLCHQAAISWVAIPTESKLRGNSPLVTTSGPTHYDATNFWNAQVTDARGASVTFPLTLARSPPSTSGIASSMATLERSLTPSMARLAGHSPRPPRPPSQPRIM